MSISFPALDPVALTIGPFAFDHFVLGPFLIRWYALAYLSGFLLGWAYALRLNRLYGAVAFSRQTIDDFIMWAVLGVIGGGRVGYVLFYNLPFFLENPSHIFYVWQGGMSFHGGASGVIIAIIAYALYHKISVFRLSDIVCATVPLGLLFGRLANFVNAELYGRVTNLPWAVVFPDTDGQPRHPSQLYEAFGEGLFLFLLLGALMRVQGVRDRPGLVSALFLIGYGACRFLVEFVREPDAQLGMLSVGLTMGQILCLPMFIGGGLVLFLAGRGWPK